MSFFASLKSCKYRLFSKMFHPEKKIFGFFMEKVFNINC